jgi:ankyrin repeat protein
MLLVAWAQGGCAASLLNACAAGDTEAVRSLLQSGHHANEAFPLIGTKPLMLAAAYGHVETAKLLLASGADVNASDATGWTALHAGAYKGDAALVTLLLERGAIQSPGRWFLQSPQRIAEMLGHQDVVDLLQGSRPSAGTSTPAAATPSP